MVIYNFVRTDIKDEYVSIIAKKISLFAQTIRNIFDFLCSKLTFGSLYIVLSITSDPSEF